MTILRSNSTESNREFWKHVLEVAKEVDRWPAWKKAASSLEPAEQPGPPAEPNALKPPAGKRASPASHNNENGPG